MDEWTLYWITRCDSIHGLCTALVIPCVFGIVAGLAGWASPDYDAPPSPSLRRAGRFCACVVILPVLALVFIPTTKEAAVIKVVPAMARSEFAQKDMPELVDLAKQWLRRQVVPPEKEVKP